MREDRREEEGKSKMVNKREGSGRKGKGKREGKRGKGGRGGEVGDVVRDRTR